MTIRSQRARTGLLAAACLTACGFAAAPALGQTNLLTNGGFDVNNGFGGVAFDTAYNGGFFGFPGWDGDVANDGLNNFNFDDTQPGGNQFFNVFPSDPTTGSGDGVPDPLLTGAGSGVILGPFDGNTTSFLFQQVAASPGEVFQGNVFGISDSSQLNGSGQPDTIFQASFENQLVAGFEFFDGAGNQLSSTSQVILDALTQNEVDVDGKWLEASFTETAPAGTELVRLAIFYNQFFFEGGLAYFDNASIVNLSAGTPLEGDLDFDGALDGDDLTMMQLAADGDLVPDGIDRFDLTNDSLVNGDDVAALQALLGTPGDFDGDDDVDVADVLELQRQGLGATELADWELNFGAGAAVAAVSAVPEPTTLLLASVAAAVLLGRRL